MPTELELIALDTEFELYLPFSKRLVLNLPESGDRARAAQWLMKLRGIKDDNSKKLRNEHLKLLLFALHRRSMVGIFEVKPPKEELESFHDGLTLLEMTRELIEITEKKAQQSGGNKDLKPGECPLPKVYSNFSCDLKEYTASQNIPKFGAHVYYAVSSQPIQFWTKSTNCDYPAMGDIPNAMQWEQVLRKLSDHVLERQDELDKKIALQKAIEAGDANADDLEPAIDFSKKITVKTCPADQFKWKKDSLLRVYQNYDFSDVKDAEDVETQGRVQLESDEEAFTLLDYSLPGRRRLNVRDPFYEGLPPDIAMRRHHGIVEEIPYEEDSDECDICSTCSEEDATRPPQECEVCQCDDDPSPKPPQSPPPVCECDDPCGGGGGGNPCGGSSPCSSAGGPRRSSRGPGSAKTLSRGGSAGSQRPCGAKSQEALRIKVGISENDRSVCITNHVDFYESGETSTELNQSEECGCFVCATARTEGDVNLSHVNSNQMRHAHNTPPANVGVGSRRGYLGHAVGNTGDSSRGTNVCQSKMNMNKRPMSSSSDNARGNASKGSVCFSKESQPQPCGGAGAAATKKCELQKPAPPKRKPTKNPFCGIKSEPKWQDPCSPPKSCMVNTKPVQVEDPCLRKSCKPPMRVPGDPLYKTSSCCAPMEPPPTPVSDCMRSSPCGSPSNLSLESSNRLQQNISPSGSSHCSCNSCKGQAANMETKISPQRFGPTGSPTRGASPINMKPSKSGCCAAKVPSPIAYASPKHSPMKGVSKHPSDLSMCDSCKQKDEGDNGCNCDACQGPNRGRQTGASCNAYSGKTVDSNASLSRKNDSELMSEHVVGTFYDNQKENEIYSTPVQAMMQESGGGYVSGGKKEFPCNSCSGTGTSPHYYAGQEFQEEGNYYAQQTQPGAAHQQYYNQSQVGQENDNWYSAQQNSGGHASQVPPTNYFTQMAQHLQDDYNHKSKRPQRRCNLSLTEKQTL